MRRFWGILGVAALATSLGGCWVQQGFDAGHTRYNPDETAITSANVDQVVQLWSADTGDVPVTWPLSVNGWVFAVSPTDGTSGNRIIGVDAATGAIAWDTTHSVSGWQMGAPVYLDGNVVVPYGYLRVGGYAFVEATTGAIVDDRGQSSGTWGSAVVDGELVTTGSFYGSVIPIPYSASIYGPCTASIAGVMPNSPPPPRTDFAYVGTDVMWNSGTRAQGFVGCDPETGQYTTTWLTELGGQPTGVVAVGDDDVAYTDATGTLTVLDSSTGAVLWTAELGGSPAAPAVAEGQLFATTGDNRLVVLNAATGAVQWEAALGEGGRATVAGDVVYVTQVAGDTILAFARAGCGAATCTPLTTITVGGDMTSDPIVDDGRLVVGTTDGRIVAYGLPDDYSG